MYGGLYGASHLHFDLPVDVWMISHCVSSTCTSNQAALQIRFYVPMDLSHRIGPEDLRPKCGALWELLPGQINHLYLIVHAKVEIPYS